MVMQYLVPFRAHQGVALGQFVVRGHHLRHQLVEAGLRNPAQLGLCLCRISQQGFDFRRTEVVRVDSDDQRPCSSYPFSSTPSPFQVILISSFSAAMLIKSRTLRCSPVAMTKSSGFSCCSISHCISA